MANEDQSERSVKIQGTVNTGSEATGVKIGRLMTRDVPVHSDTTPSPSFRGVALVGVLAFLGAVLINLVTSQLPPGLPPYLWLASMLALLVTGASIVITYRQARRSEAVVTFGTFPSSKIRARMLDKVENFWIKGVLKQSLAKKLRIALELTEYPDAVVLPLNALVQELHRPPRALPADTPIINVFDQMGGALLILGAPGAGKTTLLLELARDLITRARSDPQHPIPFVFYLSTWASKRRPLKEWLAEELNQRYYVPAKLAQQWVDADAILPLLDGLDEVAADQRPACVEAINAYRYPHGLVPLAVCSGAEEYAGLANKLKLQGAIVVQPLRQQTVDG